jgi:hypothetical protein
MSTIPVIIKRLDGEKKEMQIDATWTILQVKETFSSKMGIHVNQLRLVFRGMPMENERTVADYKIAPKDMIHIIMQLNGG